LAADTTMVRHKELNCVFLPGLPVPNMVLNKALPHQVSARGEQIARPGLAQMAAGLLLCVFGLMHSSGVDAEENVARIIGGEEARGAAWPSTVALVRTTNDNLFQRQFCAGNLVAAQWVLTAAHCLHDAAGVTTNAADIRVAAGVTDLSQTSGVTEHVIANVIVHPQYDPSNPGTYNDIALLELAQPASQRVMPLFNGDTDALVGRSTVVVGWGALAFSQFGQLPFPTVLNQVSVPLVSRAVCNQPVSYNGIIADTQLCAGFREGERDSCVGDSGGPLMLLHEGQYQQVGIVSFGRGCAEPDLYGIYTRVPAYLTWINELTGSAGSPQPQSPQAGSTPAPTTPVSERTTSETGAGAGLMVLMLGFLIGRRRQYRHATK